MERDASTFKPQGQKIFSYTRPLPHSSSTKGKGKSNIQDLDPQSEDVIEFEVYYVCCLATLSIVRRYLLLNVILFQMTWNTPGFLEYHRRMQLFVLLYIEGGSYINEEEDTWEFVIL